MSSALGGMTACQSGRRKFLAAMHFSTLTPLKFAPKPRDYSFKMNKKEKRIALLSALSSKVADNKIVVLDAFNLDEVKTKKFAEVMSNLKVDKALVVIEGENKNVVLSGRNIPTVKVSATNEINTYDVLKYETLVVTKAAVEKLEEVYA